MARARGANAVLARAFETTYGTPPASGYVACPLVSTNIGEERGLLASDLIGQGRARLAPTLDVANDEGEIVVPVDLRNFGHWLKAAFGAPTTTGSSAPFAHAFATGAASIPSMALEVGFPDVPSYGMNFGAKVNTLRVQMQRSGLLNATIGVIAQGETEAATSAAGTVADPIEVRRFAQATGAVSRNGASIGTVTAADFTFSNNLDKVEGIRPDGRIDGLDLGLEELGGNVTVRFDNRAMLAQAASGLPCSLEFGWTIGVGASLLITVHEVYLPVPKRPVEGPNGVLATFAWQAARNAAAGKLATIVLTNDVASYA